MLDIMFVICDSCGFKFCNENDMYDSFFIIHVVPLKECFNSFKPGVPFMGHRQTE